MEGQRCALCDGRGHSHTTTGSKSRRGEACPLRAILQRRLGSGQHARMVLNRALKAVLTGKYAGMKIGSGPPAIYHKRKIGGYSSWMHL